MDEQKRPGLVRALGTFDVAMILMGGIIGIGIFANPSIVARHLHSPVAILACWVVGGLFAFLGALIHAELASRLPVVGGQYAYLREGLHSSVAFVYGWTLFLVIETGGMAAVAIIFANYFVTITQSAIPSWQVAVGVLALLALINCFGIRAGAKVQNGLMTIKIVTILAVVLAGFLVAKSSPNTTISPLVEAPPRFTVSAFIVALVPILFAYGGAHKTSYIAGEVHDPRRSLVRGLIVGMSGVVMLYLVINLAYILGLGTDGLAGTDTPASDLMGRVFGQYGGMVAAIGISISALGLLSQAVMTAPRVLFAMATDGFLFRAVSRLHPRSHAPVVAILVQSVMTMIIAVVGRYEQILNYVISIESIFLGLNAVCVFALRRRAVGDPQGFCVPGHPYTTAFFILISWLIVAATFFKFPRDSIIGLAIAASGIPIYFILRPRMRK